MILSVSRRTDIPAFYSEWFINRVKEKYVLVRNPMNYHMVSRIPITPEIIDCIVFWTKNPLKMLDKLHEVEHFKYYFQFTLNPYNEDLEKSVSRKTKIIDTFKRLSDLIGPTRVIWRYDPIFFSDKINTEYHLKYFEILSSILKGYTEICVISFLDSYKRISSKLIENRIIIPDEDQIYLLASIFDKISYNYGIKIQTCSEKIDLSRYNIMHGSCIDATLIERISHKVVIEAKDKFQRQECGCISSVDIGEYNTCSHNCIYCYANYSPISVSKKKFKHSPSSPLLIGDLEPNDIVRSKFESYRII